MNRFIFTRSTMGGVLHFSGRYLLPAVILLVSTPLLAGQAPVIDQFTPSSTMVLPGEVVALTVEAHDPDCPDICTSGCGMYIREDLTYWEVTGGVILQQDNGASGSPYTASADWEAPQTEGTYTITVTVQDNGSFLCGGRESTSSSLDILVTLNPTEPPVIESLTADKLQLFPGEQSNLTCVASDPDGDPIDYTWTSELGSIVPGAEGAAVYTAEQPGLDNVACTATDPFGTFDTESIALSTSGARVEKSLTSALVTPRRLDVGPLGDIHVVDPAAGGITVINLFTGKLVYRLPLPGVTSIAVDWAGNLLVGFPDRAQLLDRRGTVLMTLTGNSGDVAGVAVDSVNQRYGVLHRRAGRIVIYDASGLQLSSFGATGDGPDQLKDPQALAVTPAGQWVVADTGHGQVKIFDLSGSLVSAFGELGGRAGSFVRLDDVLVASDGVIYASDSFQDWIQAFNPDGTLREVIGTYGQETGQFRTATGLAMAEDYDRLLAASFNGSSIQVFRTSDEPVDIPTPPSPILTPISLDFGSQVVGTVSPIQSMTLGNVGGSAMGLRSTAVDDEFSASDDCGDFIDPGQSCNIDVVFRPTTIGHRNGTLIVDTSAEQRRLGAALSGSGAQAGPLVRLNPGMLTFGDQEIGTFSAPQQVTLTNQGSSPLGISGIESTTDFMQGNNCGSSLAAGAICTMEVRFAPTRLSDSIYGSLTVTSDAAGSPHSVDLNGRSTAVIPQITIDDSIVEEGDGAGTEMTFTVSLSTPTSQTVSVEYLTEEDTALEGDDFTPAAGTLTIPAGQTERTITVQVTGDEILERDEETFLVSLANPVNGDLVDGRGVGTILDDEPCIGPNLLANPSAEERPEGSGIPGWYMVVGNNWQRRGSPPDPVDGEYFFYPGTTDYTELAQDIDVSAFANRIAMGHQRFTFEGFVHTLYEAFADSAQLIVEYRNSDNSLVLDEFDTGAFSSPSVWTSIRDERPAPPGTGWIRVRLIGISLGDAYFDALSLRSLRAVTVKVGDLETLEMDNGFHQEQFNITLACPFDEDVRVDYATFDDTAVSGEDYLGTVGSLVLPVGDTEGSVEVTIIGNIIDEPHERFTLGVTALEPADAVLLDDEGVCLIVNDDFCPRNREYWSLNPDSWLTDWLVIGGVEYDKATLLDLLGYSGSDESHILAGELVATRLNLLAGSNRGIMPTVEEADLFLAEYPPGSKPAGSQKRHARTLAETLNEYNNASCP